MHIETAFAVLSARLARRGVLAERISYWEDRRTFEHCLDVDVNSLRVEVRVDTHFVSLCLQRPPYMDIITDRIMEKLANDLQQAGL